MELELNPRGHIDGAGREDDVRNRIFASALRHFSWKGYTATSLRDICTDARTTKPMVYYYFGSKEQLYSVVVREILEDMAGTIRREALSAGPATAGAVAYCERYMDHFLANDEIIALLMREVFGLGGVPLAAFAEAFAKRIRQPLDDILRRGMDAGELRCEDVGACAMAITGILNMFILAHVVARATIDREVPIRQVQHYLRGLEAR